jgi:hypothetical protein
MATANDPVTDPIRKDHPMNNDTKPEITGVAPTTPEVTKMDATDAKLGSAPKAMTDEEKKSLDAAKQAAPTAPASTR